MRSIESLNCAVDIIVTKMPRCSNSVPLLHGYTSFTTLIAGEDSNFEMEIVREVVIDRNFGFGSASSRPRQGKARFTENQSP